MFSGLIALALTIKFFVPKTKERKKKEKKNYKEENVNSTSRVGSEVAVGIKVLADPAKGEMGHYEVLFG